MRTSLWPSLAPMLTLIWGFSLCAISSASDPAPRTLLFFGDSLTAGNGLSDPTTEAFPALIQEKVDDAGLKWRVVNAGLSGETTAGGLRRVDWVLRQPVDFFVLALGANDGLRGIPPEVSRANLQQIIDRARARNPKVKIAVAGMQMPSTMGADFTRAFRELFPDVAARNDAVLIPFLLEGVGGRVDLNQADRIHPNADGHAVIAETVWKALRSHL